jgi:hypothetical protein
MEIKRTFKSGCEWCNATGEVPYYGNPNITGGLSNICPVCKGSKTILITEEFVPDEITYVNIPTNINLDEVIKKLNFSKAKPKFPKDRKG